VQELRTKVQGLEAGMEARRQLMATLQSRPKFALIVAVSKYLYDRDLPNATIDAERLKATLDKLGWTVVIVLEPNLKKFRRAITNFATKDGRADGDCLVAFVGHAIQLNGRNYLFAADSRFESPMYLNDDKYERAAKRVCLPFHEVQAAFADVGEGVKVFVLDCCRTGLFPGVASGASSQLENSIVIYSTTSGNVADDGVPGKGGAFMGILCEEIKRSGAEGVGVSKVTERSRKRLLQTPNLHQLASDNSTLLDDFFFSSQRWQQVSLNPLSHMAPPIQRAVDFAVGRIEQRE